MKSLLKKIFNAIFKRAPKRLTLEQERRLYTAVHMAELFCNSSEIKLQNIEQARQAVHFLKGHSVEFRLEYSGKSITLYIFPKITIQKFTNK